MALRAVSGITRAQAAALSQAEVGALEWVGPRVFSVSSAVVAIDTLYATPYIAEQTFVADQVALSVTTGAAGNAKMGLYASTGNRPGALVAEGSADISTASAAMIASTFAAPPLLRAGTLYWIVAVFSGAPTVRTYNALASNGGGYFGPVGTLQNDPGLWVQGSSGRFVSRALTYVSGPTPFFPATFGAPTLTTPIGIPFAVRKAA